MMRRSSSSTPKAPMPLSSRSNDTTRHPMKTRRSKKPSGIPRLSFRRLAGSKHRQQERGGGGDDDDDDDDRRPSPADRQVAERPPLDVDEDDDDVQYIDLDVVVMASPGTDESTCQASSIEEDVDDDDGDDDDDDEQGRLEPPLNDDLIDHSSTSPRLPAIGPSVEALNDNHPAELLESRPATPPRRREQRASNSLPATPSPPRRSASPAAYQLPDSLRKRRRGSPKRILWLGGDRSPIAGGSGPESNEWAHVQTLGWEEQLAAFWDLLYPNQPRNVVPPTAAAQGPVLRSCLKRQRQAERDDEDPEENPHARKVLQWGSNSAVEFEMSALDFMHLSPATVELRFPATLDRYEELHPVDEEMVQLTKENSAILAALEGLDDDSSSESSIGSNDETHCFEDTDDDEDYRPPVRLPSSARKSRRESGIFTPAPFLDSSSPDPVPPSSPGVMSPFDKLSLTSPVKGHVASSTTNEEQVFTASPLAPVAKRVPNKQPTTEHSSKFPFVISTEEERSEKRPAHASVHANWLKADTSATSVGALSVLTWQQKLSQVCLSPVSGAMGMDNVPPLEKICSKLASLAGNANQDTDGATSFSTVGGLSWLEPFDACPSLRKVVDRSFTMARGAVSLLPPVNHGTCFEEDVELLAQSEWLEIEIKVLETMAFELATGPMRDVSAECDKLAQQTLKVGKAFRIRNMALQEEQELLRKEAELRKLECDFERLKQLQAHTELASVVRSRYSTHLLQAVSPFALMDTDGAVSRLAFPTPVQGLDVAAIHKMGEPLVIEREASHGPSTASNGVDTRFDPTHPCSTFYSSLLNACLKNMSKFCPAGGMGNLLALEFILGRLEDAFWDVHHFCSEASDTTIDVVFVDDGTEFVFVSASIPSGATFEAVYDCSDFRTLYSCRPTFAQLDGRDASKPISRSYPQGPLMGVMEELVSFS